MYIDAIAIGTTTLQNQNNEYLEYVSCIKGQTMSHITSLPKFDLTDDECSNFADKELELVCGWNISKDDNLVISLWVQ